MTRPPAGPSDIAKVAECASPDFASPRLRPGMLTNQHTRGGRSEHGATIRSWMIMHCSA
jgi:hypothetical protein